MPKSRTRALPRLVRRRSGIHGTGVFTREFIRAGSCIIEYAGERITEAEGDERYPYYADVPYHTFLFKLDDDLLVDGGCGGNISRWINHSCDPNCESAIEDERIFIYAARDIHPGEELTYDYHFILAERHTPAVKKRYPCACGAPSCRGTMIGKKR